METALTDIGNANAAHSDVNRIFLLSNIIKPPDENLFDSLKCQPFVNKKAFLYVVNISSMRRAKINYALCNLLYYLHYTATLFLYRKLTDIASVNFTDSCFLRITDNDDAFG